MFDYSLLHYAKEHYELRLKSAERGAWEQALLKDGRPSLPVQRVLWQVGELFVRSGQWLQDRFCVEPACT